MNKVIQANLGGLAFTFDDAAYDLLDDYLAALDGYFRGTPGHADVMHDIEARLAELFQGALKGRAIVTLADVEGATATLGTVDQLTGAAPLEDESPEPEPEARSFRHRGGRRRRRDSRQGYSRYGRKLMRDPEDAKLGGVCSGLAAYFGVADPIWFRLAFVAAVVFGGFGVLPYVILWIVVPEAHTAGDRLAMRGEPIDLDGIASEVERGAHRFAEQVEAWGERVSASDWGSGKKWRRNGWSKRPPRGGRRRRRGEEEPVG